MGRTSKPEGENAAAPKPDQGDGKQTDEQAQTVAKVADNKAADKTAGDAGKGEGFDKAASEMSKADAASIVTAAGGELAAGDILSFRLREDSLTVVTTQGRKIRIVADENGEPRVAD